MVAYTARKTVNRLAHVRFQIHIKFESCGARTNDTINI